MYLTSVISDMTEGSVKRDDYTLSGVDSGTVFFHVHLICLFCGIKLPRVVKWGLVFFDILIHFCVWSCDWNPLYYTSMTFDGNASIPHVILGKGPLYLVNAIVVIIQLGISIFLAARHYIHTPRQRRRGAFLVLCSVMIPMIFFTISITCDMGGYDLTPISESISTLFLVIATQQHHIFDLVSNAYDNIIQNMDEAIIIADNTYGFMEANHQARTLFPEITQYKERSPILNETLNHLFQSEADQFQSITRPVQLSELTEKINDIFHIKNSNKMIPDRNRNREKKLILLIDDNSLQLRTIRSILQPEYNVMMSTSGPEAIRLIGKNAPDLIFLDYEMPGCDGRMTLEMIRSLKENRNIPVVFLTAISDKAHIRAVLSLKPAGYLLKPASRESILKTASSILR